MIRTRVEPHIGEVWRERRSMYAKRHARVVDLDESFVYVQTIVREDGVQVTKPRKPTRVRRTLWDEYWIPARSDNA